MAPRAAIRDIVLADWERPAPESVFDVGDSLRQRLFGLIGLLPLLAVAAFVLVLFWYAGRGAAALAGRPQVAHIRQPMKPTRMAPTIPSGAVLR